MIRGMAPLLPLGFAILGLGCTVPLTIGGSDFDPSEIGPPTDDAGPSPIVDSGTPILDAGAPIVDAGNVQDAGCTKPGNAAGSYASCCTPDLREGLCYSAPQGWSCSDLRVCTSSGGNSCNSTGHTCTSFSDCCTNVCYKGFCASTTFPGEALDAGSSGVCTANGFACSTYSDCCSQNCAFGACAVAPTIPKACGGFLSTCQTSTDCCSLECDNGNCRDGTLPWYLQTVGAQLGDREVTPSTPNENALAPHFDLNRAENLAGENPMR
jgi:hypothetical protein